MSVPSNVVSILNPQIPVNQSIYETSTTQKTRLGTRLVVGDRTFYYAKLSTSANVGAGLVVATPSLVASNQSGIAFASSAATNATTITVSVGTAVTANQYADGYISIANSVIAGYGWLYRIKSHPAVATNASGAFTLYDAIPSSLGSSPCNLMPCLYRDVKIAPSTAADAPGGVTPIAVTTGEYFWLQTWGPANVYHSAATPAGAALRMATLGYVEAFSATGTLGATGNALINYVTIIGKNSNLAATATEYNPVFLTITP